MPEEERKFKSKLLLKDMKRVDLKPSDLMRADEDWDITVKVLNALLISGKKFDDNSSLNELQKYQDIINKAFL